jgi:K+-sensing histidine kinase KdpD
MVLSDWLARHRPAVWTAAVFLGPVVAALLTLARPQLHENHVTLVLVLAVAVVSAVGLRPAGLVAALTTALAYDYFWTGPYYSFRIFDTQDVLTVLLLVLVGAAIEQLSWWASRQRAVAVRRLDYLTALRRAAEPIPPETQVAALEAIADTLLNVLDADSCDLARIHRFVWCDGVILSVSRCYRLRAWCSGWPRCQCVPHSSCRARRDRPVVRWSLRLVGR